MTTHAHGARRRRRIAAALVMLTALFAAPARADHGDPSVVIIGLDDRGRQAEELHVQDVTVTAGAILAFFFDNGTHNVTSWSQPAATAALTSAAAPGAEPVGSTFAYTFDVPGEYLYFCSIHEDDPGGRFTNGEPQPGEMVGRVTVLPDTTPPVWSAGTATATAASDTQISLTWPAATDDSGSVTYEIYEASEPARPTKPASPVATTSGLTATRTGLSADTQSWYWITAVDPSANVASPDQLADAVTLAASGTLAITLSLPTVDFATVGPLDPAIAGFTATVTSDAPWSLTVKSVGRNGVDDSPGDDAVFTSDSGSTIPVSRLTWDAGAGPQPLSDNEATILAGRPPTPPEGTAVPIDLTLSLRFDDPEGVGYRTTMLYTVTQP